MRKAWNGAGPGFAITPRTRRRRTPPSWRLPMPSFRTFPVSGTARAEWSADRAVVELYSQHYRALVRLAALLVRDTQTAEEVVQDSFVAMHEGWQRLRDTEKALAYLRQAVVNRSRSVLRHRTVVDKNLQKAPPDMPSAEHGALVLLERSAVVAALRHLPDRQREAIVLRYYADLSEAEIATAMGISRGAVKSIRPAAWPPCARHWSTNDAARRPWAGERPGTGTRTRNPLSFAEFVRLALHAAADQVEPRADGLAPIRARILAAAGVPGQGAGDKPVLAGPAIRLVPESTGGRSDDVVPRGARGGAWAATGPVRHKWSYR